MQPYVIDAILLIINLILLIQIDLGTHQRRKATLTSQHSSIIDDEILHHCPYLGTIIIDDNTRLQWHKRLFLG